MPGSFSPRFVIERYVQQFINAMRDRLRDPDRPGLPRDPDSLVTAPKRYGPSDRITTASVPEPIDDERIVAAGVRNGGRGAVGLPSSNSR